MLFAIFTQLREGSRLTSIPKLYLSVKDYIYTDLTAEQIAALAVFGMDLVPGESLVRHTLKGKYISGTAYNGASFYVLDTRALKKPYEGYIRRGYKGGLPLRLSLHTG